MEILWNGYDSLRQAGFWHSRLHVCLTRARRNCACFISAHQVASIYLLYWWILHFAAVAHCAQYDLKSIKKIWNCTNFIAPSVKEVGPMKVQSSHKNDSHGFLVALESTRLYICPTYQTYSRYVWGAASMQLECADRGHRTKFQQTGNRE